MPSDNMINIETMLDFDINDIRKKDQSKERLKSLEDENRIISERLSVLENIIGGSTEIINSEIKKAIIIKMRKMNSRQAEIIVKIFESRCPNVPILVLQQDMEIQFLEDEDLARIGLKRIN
jgi:hypothetical protein